jgi:hypothetical protein
MMAWMLAGLVAAIYCIARGIVDLRQRRHVWGALGICIGAFLLLVPEPTHAVKLDLPMSTPDNGLRP